MPTFARDMLKLAGLIRSGQCRMFVSLFMLTRLDSSRLVACPAMSWLSASLVWGRGGRVHGTDGSMGGGARTAAAEAEAEAACVGRTRQLGLNEGLKERDVRAVPREPGRPAEGKKDERENKKRGKWVSQRGEGKTKTRETVVCSSFLRSTDFGEGKGEEECGGGKMVTRGIGGWKLIDREVSGQSGPPVAIRVGEQAAWSVLPAWLGVWCGAVLASGRWNRTVESSKARHHAWEFVGGLPQAVDDRGRELPCGYIDLTYFSLKAFGYSTYRQYHLHRTPIARQRLAKAGLDQENSQLLHARAAPQQGGATQRHSRWLHYQLTTRAPSLLRCVQASKLSERESMEGFSGP